eukprot:gene12028-biopygen13289
MKIVHCPVARAPPLAPGSAGVQGIVRLRHLSSFQAPPVHDSTATLVTVGDLDPERRDDGVKHPRPISEYCVGGRAIVADALNSPDRALLVVELESRVPLVGRGIEQLRWVEERRRQRQLAPVCRVVPRAFDELEVNARLASSVIRVQPIPAAVGGAVVVHEEACCVPRQDIRDSLWLQA